MDSALAALAGEHEKNLALRAQLQALQTQQRDCEEELRALHAMEAQRKKAQLYDAKRAAMQAANRWAYTAALRFSSAGKAARTVSR